MQSQWDVDLLDCPRKGGYPRKLNFRGRLRQSCQIGTPMHIRGFEIRRPYGKGEISKSNGRQPYDRAETAHRGAIVRTDSSDACATERAAFSCGVREKSPQRACLLSSWKPQARDNSAASHSEEVPDIWRRSPGKGNSRSRDGSTRPATASVLLPRPESARAVIGCRGKALERELALAPQTRSWQRSCCSSRSCGGAQKRQKGVEDALLREGLGRQLGAAAQATGAG